MKDQTGRGSEKLQQTKTKGEMLGCKAQRRVTVGESQTQQIRTNTSNHLTRVLVET